MAPRHVGDREPKRLVRQNLRRLNDTAAFHDRPYSWGLTIFRTVYTPASDEAFPRAIERLKQRAHLFVVAEGGFGPWVRVGIKANLFSLCVGIHDYDLYELGDPDPADGIQNWYGLYPYM